MLNGALTIPSAQKKYSWVSAVEAGPYHVETHASAGQGGNAFRALCGASGLFNCYLNARQIFPAQKCATCQQLSTSGILDIGVAPQQENLTKAVNYEGRIAEDATVHGDAGCGEKRPAEINCGTHPTIKNTIGVAPQGVAGVSGECGESAEQEQNQAGVVSDEGQDSKLLRSEADNLPAPPLSNEHLLADSKFDVADQEKSRIGSLGGGHPASVPSPGRFDASVDRMMHLTDEALRQRVDAEMKARHVPNFSVSSTIDDRESRY